MQYIEWVNARKAPIKSKVLTFDFIGAIMLYME